MEKSRFGRALEAAAKVFKQGIEELQRVEGKVHIARAKAINFAIDEGKAEGLTKAAIVAGIDTEVLEPAVLCGGISTFTRINYRSSVGKAITQGVPWTASSHKTLKVRPKAKAKAKAKAEAKTPSARKASKAVTVKLDAKAKTVTLTVPSWTKPDEVAEPMLAVLSEAGRFALFQAWMKSHGWIEA